MIVVDTSVWVAAARAPLSSVAVALRNLIDSDDAVLALPVRLELLAGVKRSDRRALIRGLTALPVVVPSEATWQLIERWIAPAADQGHRFGVTDLLIAGLASEIGALVRSLDADFQRMKSLGFAQVYETTSDVV